MVWRNGYQFKRGREKEYYSLNGTCSINYYQKITNMKYFLQIVCQYGRGDLGMTKSTVPGHLEFDGY